MSFAQFVLIGQLLAVLPAMPEGTEVRLVSKDLLTIYATATVHGTELLFVDFPPAGTEVRVLIFPPDAAPADVVESLSTARALVGRISPDGTDVLLTEPADLEPLSLRTLLSREHNVMLELAVEED
jgi:hypothetical protein